METLFQTVKRAVPVPEAAARYGLEAGPSGMARCPFHPDKTPSLKLYDDHYYCFGCHAHGDVIQLASGLLGLSPYAAARTLADAFGLPSPSGRPPKPSPCAEGVWRSVPDAGRPPARLQLRPFASRRPGASGFCTPICACCDDGGRNTPRPQQATCRTSAGWRPCRCTTGSTG